MPAVIGPVLLIVSAVLAATAVAYGTEPLWASYPHGLGVILWCRRLQWPLVVVAVAASLGVIGVVAGGRRRAWWLAGVVPVAALLAHRFVTGPGLAFAAVDDPPTVSAAGAAFLRDDDWVVGVVANGEACAYPYAVLFHRPVIVRADPGGRRRTAVFWSAYANCATAVSVDWDVRGRDLEVVSFPVNAVLAYDRRLGQFVNGVTGRTPGGGVPVGFGRAVATVKTTWAAWRAGHPRTVVVGPADAGWTASPAGPVPPRWRVPGEAGLPDTRLVCVVGNALVMPSDRVGRRPWNGSAGPTPVLVVRGADGAARAFDRSVPGDLVPRFAVASDPSRPAVAWVDADVGATWSAEGALVAGPAELKGARLAAVPVVDDLYRGVERYWCPGLHEVTDGEVAAGVASGPAANVERRTSSVQRRKRK